MISSTGLVGGWAQNRDTSRMNSISAAESHHWSDRGALGQFNRFGMRVLKKKTHGHKKTNLNSIFRVKLQKFKKIKKRHNLQSSNSSA